MTYIYKCNDSRCRHEFDQHKGLSVVDGKIIDEGDYPPPDGFGPNRCLVEGCVCADYTYPPWTAFPNKRAWEEAVRTGGDPP